MHGIIFQNIDNELWMLQESVGSKYACEEEEEEEQSLKLALGHPWIWSVSDFIFLASAYAGGWPVISVTVSSSHWQCAVSGLIIAELDRGSRRSRNLKKFLPWPGFDPGLLDCQSSTLTTRLPRTQGMMYWWWYEITKLCSCTRFSVTSLN